MVWLRLVWDSVPAMAKVAGTLYARDFVLGQNVVLVIHTIKQKKKLLELGYLVLRWGDWRSSMDTYWYYLETHGTWIVHGNCSST
jgi:hypothetical protein